MTNIVKLRLLTYTKILLTLKRTSSEMITKEYTERGAIKCQTLMQKRLNRRCV